jgi:hypothetical protein
METTYTMAFMRLAEAPPHADQVAIGRISLLDTRSHGFISIQGVMTRLNP